MKTENQMKPCYMNTENTGLDNAAQVYKAAELLRAQGYDVIATERAGAVNDADDQRFDSGLAWADWGHAMTMAIVLTPTA